MRKPGMVLRVSKMRALVPLMASTYFWVAVAVADRDCERCEDASSLVRGAILESLERQELG